MKVRKTTRRDKSTLASFLNAISSLDTLAARTSVVEGGPEEELLKISLRQPEEKRSTCMVD